jgi:protoporphyrinogen oxidase
LEKTRFLVVGAGVTGLSFADWVKSDDYIVCEALDEVGGYCRTIKQDGFIWDFSGHFFHFKNRHIEEYLLERMGDQKVRKVAKEARIDYEGTIVDFPFQKNIHQLPKEDFIDCLVDLYFKEEREASNFKEMLYAKFGRSISEKFLIPYNEKLYATDLANLDVDAMGRFFPYADIDEIVANFRQSDNASYNSTFTYPEGGAIQYVKALQAGVDSDKLSLNERVVGIDLDGKVARTTKREIAYDVLISSMPMDKLLRLSGVTHDPNVFSYNKVLVFNLGFDRKGPEGVHWMYYPSRELAFYRVGFYDNIFGTDRMSMYVELGFPPDEDITDADVVAYRDRVLEDLKRVGVVDGHQLVSWHSVVLDPAYVHITQESVAAVAQAKEQLESKGVHSAGRYGSWTYCSIEDNIVEARVLAERYS